MIRMQILGLLVVFLSISAAEAGLPRSSLELVGASPPPGAHVDLSFSAQDTTGRRRSLGEILEGRPAFFVFVDYTCNTLCGTDLLILGDAIARAKLVSSEFRLVVVGIDAKDSAQSAIDMENRDIPHDLRPSTTFLLPEESAIGQVTKALGYRFAYDPESDQFAHPAVIYALGPDGRMRHMFSPLRFEPEELKGLLFEQAETPSHLPHSIRSLCYAYDPLMGVYSLRIGRLLKATAALTIVLLGSSIFLLFKKGRRDR